MALVFVCFYIQLHLKHLLYVLVLLLLLLLLLCQLIQAARLLPGLTSLWCLLPLTPGAVADEVHDRAVGHTVVGSPCRQQQQQQRRAHREVGSSPRVASGFIYSSR